MRMKARGALRLRLRRPVGFETGGRTDPGSSQVPTGSCSITMEVAIRRRRFPYAERFRDRGWTGSKLRFLNWSPSFTPRAPPALPAAQTLQQVEVLLVGLGC